MDIVCGSCGSDNLIRDPEAPVSPGIPLLCLDCGWRGRRQTSIACPRCGSREYEESPVDSWAYADLEDARDHPDSAAWGYVDKTVRRCVNCRHEWTTAGPYRPYE